VCLCFCTMWHRNVPRWVLETQLFRQKVKHQGHESQKHCRHGSLHSCDWLIDWLSSGFASHPTQNRSFRRRFALLWVLASCNYWLCSLYGMVLAVLTDPLLVSLAQDVFTVLAKNELCISALQQRLLPTLLSILQATSDKVPFGMQSVRC